MDRVAQGRHRRGRTKSPTRNVADDQQKLLVLDGDRVIPVAADVYPLHARLVARAGLEPSQLRQLGREQRVLKRLRDATLLGVQPAVLVGDLLQAIRELLGPAASLDQAN